ncbi:MAG: VOC family protein [Myxococcales bacterium]|nr:VOC family protein [Myxococcales bacterium]
MAPPPKAKKGKKAQKVDDKPWRAIAGTPAQARRPAQYHSVTPAFVVADAAATIEFYKSAFGATEIARMPAPDGKLMHAELKFGDSILMLSDENLEMGAKSPATLGGAAVALHMYSEDVDGLFAQATAAKAIPVMPIGDMFWGDRYGAVVDIAGYMWGLATHKEDLSPEEMAERMKAQMAAS